MTWSIVARHPSGALGVAVASKFFAVGALCPAVRSTKGALSTQALVNPLYARDGLAALDAGLAPAEIVRALTQPDAGRDMRQVHVVDAAGRSAAHTGKACIEWCGHLTREGFSVAGNMLASPRVIEETARVDVEGAGLAFAERLITAMEAGEAAGGDKRGRQGAALLIHTTEDYPFLSLRVDDHADPLAELRRLHAVSLERFQPFMECLPSRAQPSGITDRALIEERIARFQADRAAV
ncbi:MAG: DUF1028 domain-containing protein [Usitatibacter sp.]